MIFGRDDKPDETPIEVAVRLAPLIADHVPDDMTVAIFVFRKRDASDEADIGWNANIPVGRLRAWLTTWLVEPDGVAYMPVPRCETCTWWHGGSEGSNETSDGRKTCTEPTISPEQMDELMTLPGFGCVQWKEKK